ncbi:protein toll-like [Microplitis mediator]|uniref:protein toll-like n=1 Tax=Microplitis mediator TaxID=375433 RepID=UPI0025552C17|nr:protein toll-like [Microplitis mediator]
MYENSKDVIITCNNPSNQSDLSNLKYYKDFQQYIKFVTIANINAINVPYNLFFHAYNLEYLDLSRNKISSIPNALFNFCDNLKTLNLSSNHLSTNSFDPDIPFPILNKLESLDLSNNNITSLNRTFLTGLSSLRYLYMSHNNMRTIDPLAFQSQQNLRTLDLSHNNLVFTPNKFIDEFGSISPFHFSHKTLVDINLAYNNIDQIFADWNFAIHLETLNLSHNHLTELQQPHLQFLSGKVYVDLSFNDITKIDYRAYEIFSEYNENIRLLVNIENNPVECNCELYKMSIYLKNNYKDVKNERIKLAIGKFICSRPERETDNSVCKLDKPLENVIGECPSACSCTIRPEDKTLLVDCSYRQLNEAPDAIPWFPGSNIELNLTGNHLTRIPSRKQIGYNHTTVLSLSNNKINEITTDLPSDNLEQLYLDHNNLQKINNQVLDLLRTSKKLKSLSLHGNKWECNCATRNLFSFIQVMEDKIPELKKITCDGTNISIFTMALDKLCPSTLFWVIGLCVVTGILGIISGVSLVFHCSKAKDELKKKKSVYGIHRPTIQITNEKNELVSVIIF